MNHFCGKTLRILSGVGSKYLNIFNTFLRERLTYLYGKNEIKNGGSGARFLNKWPFSYHGNTQKLQIIIKWDAMDNTL